MSPAKVDAEEQVVVFAVGKDVYGLDISHVQEIITRRPISKIPLAPKTVKGVINLRGKVVPVVDLRQCLGLASTGEAKSTRIIVVRIQDNTVGIVVDNASEVLRISWDDIEPAPRLLTGDQTEYFRGIAKVRDRLIGLLDLEKLLASRTQLASLNTV